MAEPFKDAIEVANTRAEAKASARNSMETPKKEGP
jgi:hypothetical protein